jgi:hypothetical protein
MQMSFIEIILFVLLTALFCPQDRKLKRGEIKFDIIVSASEKKRAEGKEKLDLEEGRLQILSQMKNYLPNIALGGLKVRGVI